MFTTQVSSIKLEQAKRKVKKNLKKMRRFNEQYAKSQQVVEQETPKQEIEYNQPTIKIVNDPAPAPAKQPEKFVYRVE